MKIKKVNSLISTVVGIFLLSGSVALAQSEYNNDLTLYFNNNDNPKTYYAIEHADCWKIKNDKEINILNISGKNTTKVELQPTCTKSQAHKNIYKVSFMNRTIIAVRDLPRQNKRCIGLFWNNPLTNESVNRVYCEPLDDLSNIQIDLKMTPSNIKFFKKIPQKLGKPKLQKLQLNEEI
ncbi:hypothetical protein L3V82_04065 [Thiotrichales bacterium 19S3-7]|nr:hypothetical protein [Thiotrichales bacterium 19S3-7]MCF6801850.1 hypothetical protein [Thiotrichales bacterium 19S3-11]